MRTTITNDEVQDRIKLLEELDELESDVTRRMSNDDLVERLKTLRELDELEEIA